MEHYLLQVSIAGTYMSLNGDIIPNHGYVVISDIGYTDDSALICHNNRPATLFHSGDWFAPDVTRVSHTDVPGFRRNRAPMMVRLLRNNATDPPSEGIYHCLVENYSGIIWALFVGLYGSEGGMTI